MISGIIWHNGSTYKDHLQNVKVHPNCPSTCPAHQNPTLSPLEVNEEDWRKFGNATFERFFVRKDKNLLALGSIPKQFLSAENQGKLQALVSQNSTGEPSIFQGEWLIKSISDEVRGTPENASNPSATSPGHNSRLTPTPASTPRSFTRENASKPMMPGPSTSHDSVLTSPPAPMPTTPSRSRSIDLRTLSQQEAIVGMTPRQRNVSVSMTPRQRDVSVGMTPGRQQSRMFCSTCMRPETNEAFQDVGNAAEVGAGSTNNPSAEEEKLEQPSPRCPVSSLPSVASWTSAESYISLPSTEESQPSFATRWLEESEGSGSPGMESEGSGNPGTAFHVYTGSFPSQEAARTNPYYTRGLKVVVVEDPRLRASTVETKNKHEWMVKSKYIPMDWMNQVKRRFKEHVFYEKKGYYTCWEWVSGLNWRLIAQVC